MAGPSGLHPRKNRVLMLQPSLLYNKGYNRDSFPFDGCVQPPQIQSPSGEVR
jgi:hypothetical protein